MKYIMMLLCVLIMCSSAFHRAKKECRKAYAAGYYVGCSTKMCNLGFDYTPGGEEKFKYVGEGNEDYSIYPYRPKMSYALEKRRGNGFWWADKAKEDK